MMNMPCSLWAQTTHVVEMGNIAYMPAHITIQAGDTVRWFNPGRPTLQFWIHNVIADDLSFTSGPISEHWEYEYTFNEAGVWTYYCQRHAVDGMRGSVTVEGSAVPPPMDINPGLNGNWWNGPDRNGEGVQIEVADAGEGALVFIATFYSYGPDGGQIFLVAVGTPDGNSVQVDVFITDGGTWGGDFDPNDVNETQWGAGAFTVVNCDQINMTLFPNEEFEQLGYSILSYELGRLTTPELPCPYEVNQ